MIKRTLAALAFIFMSVVTFAQERTVMAEQMRSNGKIYVVVAVMLTIFIGIIIYLIRLDRKITNLEK